MKRDPRIQGNFSVAIKFGDETHLVDRVHDRVDIFKWLGFGIIKIVTEQGFLQWHTLEEDALAVAEKAGIVPQYRQEIADSEYEAYLDTQAFFLNDELLGGSN